MFVLAACFWTVMQGYSVSIGTPGIDPDWSCYEATPSRRAALDPKQNIPQRTTTIYTSSFWWLPCAHLWSASVLLALCVVRKCWRSTSGGAKALWRSVASTQGFWVHYRRDHLHILFTALFWSWSRRIRFLPESSALCGNIPGTGCLTPH